MKPIEVEERWKCQTDQGLVMANGVREERGMGT
jgi:hypothetical protein